MTNEVEAVEAELNPNDLQITKVIVIGEYADHRPYEQEVHAHVLLGEGDGCTLNLQVINALIEVNKEDE